MLVEKQISVYSLKKDDFAVLVLPDAHDADLCIYCNKFKIIELFIGRFV